MGVDEKDSIRLRHMLDAAREAAQFAANESRESLENNRMLVLALVKEIEIIGEAAAHVSQALQEENAALSTRISELESLVRDKAEAEKRHEELTALVRTKIDSLIGRLEGITEE